MNTTICFFVLLGIFMDRRKCEAVACLSSQMKCNSMNFYIVYSVANKFDLIGSDRPRKDEKLSWPSWLTYSGRFTHIVVIRQLPAERRTSQGQFTVRAGSVRRRSANCYALTLI